jgi:hypothetical protein
MERVCFSEMLVSAYKSTRRHNPEEQHRHLYRRENLKSHWYNINYITNSVMTNSEAANFSCRRLQLDPRLKADTSYFVC